MTQTQRMKTLLILAKRRDAGATDRPSFATGLLPGLALALLVPSLAPTTAQAQTLPAVSIYGRANVSLDQLDDGNRSRLNENSNSSRIGFRARHALENDLTVLMQLEQEIRWDHGSGEFATRDSFVGLQGGFGLLRLGYMDTPLKAVRGEVDFFGDQIGDARNLTRIRDGYTGGDFDFDARFRNSVAWTSPKFGGLTWALNYSTNTNEGLNEENNSAVSTALSYADGPWYLALAYERKQETGSSAVRLGAKFTTGPWSVAGLAQMTTVKGSSLGGTQDVNVYGVGASYKLTDAWTLKGQYYILTADGSERDASMAAIGVDYRLASQLRLMFAYARTSNDANVRYGASRGGHGGQQLAAAPGLDASGLSIALRYDF